MSDLPAKHWPIGVPIVHIKPGDFWFNDEEDDSRGDIVKWLRFGCPRGRGQCSVPISPQRTSAGHTWQWNGNREVPTLTPSINCGGCGWHGFVTAGVFTKAP